MPVLDMPLSELKTYMGANPCPPDIDEFWDKSLAEMKAVDPNVQLTKSAFQAPGAECFDLYFTGAGGARVYAKYLRPAKIDKPAPAVLMFHGYSGHSGDWCSKLNYVNMGFCVAALDCRGQGGHSEDVGGVKGTTFHGQIIRGLDGAPENMLFRNIFLDTAQLAGIVMSFPEADETRVAATGGSQGGGLTLACASLEPRVKLAAAMYPFLCDYKRVWDMDLDLLAYEELRTYFRNFDPLHKREDEIFTKLGYIDCQNIVKRVKAETLMLTGLLDNMCPPSSQFAAYNKITAPKNVLIWPDYGHEWLRDGDDIIYRFLSKLTEA